MGHEGYLTEVYRRYSVEQLAEFYKEGEHTLHIFTSKNEVSKIKSDMEKDRELFMSLAKENIELKQRLNRVESFMEKYNDFVSFIKSLETEDLTDAIDILKYNKSVKNFKPREAKGAEKYFE